MPYKDKEKDKQYHYEYKKRWRQNKENRRRELDRNNQLRKEKQETLRELGLNPFEKEHIKWVSFKEEIKAYKEEKGCFRCGTKQNLHLHHEDKHTKTCSISDMRSYTRDKVLLELSKCVVVCRGCHMKIHAKEKRRDEMGLFSGGYKDG